MESNPYENIDKVVSLFDEGAVNKYLEKEWVILGVCSFEGFTFSLGWDKTKGEVVYPQRDYDEDF